MKIRIPKDQLVGDWGLPHDPTNGAVVMEDAIVRHSRWSVHHRLVFAVDGKFYRAEYSVGATEMQENGAWDEYEGCDFIECTIVEPLEKTVTVYEEVNS